MAYFEQVQAESLPARIQYDYLQAYLAFYREDPAAAATIAAQFKDYPVGKIGTVTYKVCLLALPAATSSPRTPCLSSPL